MRKRPSLVDSRTRGARAIRAMTRGFARAGWLGIAVVGTVTLACGEPVPGDLLGEPACDELIRADVPARPNLVIIVNDTMRRDHLSLYGGPAATPHLDAFARENVHFENAFSQAPWTKPSITTLFTSLYPSQHRVASDPQLRQLQANAPNGGVTRADVLPPDFETMAEVLHRAGYRTGAFVSNPWMGARFGFDQGFEVYDDSFASWESDGETVVEAALAWIDQLPSDQPYFVYLHLLDSHRPYGEVSTKDLAAKRRRFNRDGRETGADAEILAHVIRFEDGRSAASAGFESTRSLILEAYRSGIETFDAHFEGFTSVLRKHPRWDETAVIVTSDHGEALYERGYGNHGGGLYDDETAIPLLARLPGVDSKTAAIECLTGLIDVMPSVCSYLAIACPEESAGWSFVSKLDAAPAQDRRFLVTEGVMNREEHRSVRNRHHKLVFEPAGGRDGRQKATPWSLYDLATDTAERIDRTDPAHASEASRAVLETMIGAMSEAVGPMANREAVTIEVDRFTAARLAAIGYAE